MLITSTPMAAAAPSLAQRVLARLANAGLTFGTATVHGALADEPADLILGGAAVHSSRKLFRCLQADLAEVGAVTTGTPCTIAGGAFPGAWQVAEPPQAHPLAGMVTLTLELA